MNRIQKNLLICLTSVILVFMSWITSSAQSSSQLSKIYLEGGIGGSTYKGLTSEVGLTAIFKKKWSVTVSMNDIEEMTPKNEPSDYQPETGYVLFIPYTDEETVNMKIVSLTAGRYFHLGRSMWATAEGGLSYVKGEKVNYERTQQVSNFVIVAGSISSNYKTTNENKSTVGAMLKADFNWAFASFMGIGGGVFANINSVQSPVGCEVKLMVGLMGREKKHKNTDISR
jgi:hypothetical protein